jgi:hypothetical protein
VVSPPRTVKPRPLATTVVRERATGSCQDSTPASRETGRPSVDAALAARPPTPEAVVEVVVLGAEEEGDPPLASE